MNSTQVTQSEEQEQPAKEGQKLCSLSLIKIEVLHWRRKPSEKPSLTAPAGESHDLLRMPPPPQNATTLPELTTSWQRIIPVLTGAKQEGKVRRKEIKISRDQSLEKLIIWLKKPFQQSFVNCPCTGLLGEARISH